MPSLSIFFVIFKCQLNLLPMRYFFGPLAILIAATGFGQTCPEQSSEVNISNFVYSYDVPFLEGETYLDNVNDPIYSPSVWSIGTGISNSNLAVFDNGEISGFIGLKRRNVVAPADNFETYDNLYGIEPGFSPIAQNSSEYSDLARWNAILFVDLGPYTFADVDVRLYIDFDPAFNNTLDEMFEIKIADQMSGFGFSPENFHSFGSNQNLASNIFDAFDDPAIMDFDPLAEGFYTIAIALYDACGNNVMTLSTKGFQSEELGTPDADGDGIPDSQEVSGCMQPDACNFDANATEEDFSCVFDENPLNFEAVLELDDDVATWPSNEYYTTSGPSEEVSFADYAGRLEDGRYHVTRVYSALSTCGNPISCGQLLIAGPDQFAGCTNAAATNYDASAINDDGSCNYDPSCVGDLNEDNIVGATDLLILLSAFGIPCP